MKECHTGDFFLSQVFWKKKRKEKKSLSEFTSEPLFLFRAAHTHLPCQGWLWTNGSLIQWNPLPLFTHFLFPSIFFYGCICKMITVCGPGLDPDPGRGHWWGSRSHLHKVFWLVSGVEVGFISRSWCLYRGHRRCSHFGGLAEGQLENLCAILATFCCVSLEWFPDEKLNVFLIG